MLFMIVLPTISQSQIADSKAELDLAFAEMQARYRIYMNSINEIFNNHFESPFNEENPDDSQMMPKDALTVESMNIPNAWPIRKKIIVSSNFGYRKDPFSKKKAFHKGIDIAMPLNTPVYATAIGTVSRLGYDKLLGNFIVIDHGNFESIYGHLSKIIVQKLDQVTAETLIGFSGNSGRSTGPHLHFQINDKKAGKAINPQLLINKP